MKQFDINDLKKLYMPSPSSHKGQNGKLAIIGGSHLFHGASLWALKVASRIVDMVFYSSVSENNEIAQKLKSELYDLIVVPRDKIEDYLKEAEVILIGPGLPREGGRQTEEDSTGSLVEELLKKFSNKKWVIDGGAITEIDPEWLKQMNGKAIVTPHEREFERLFNFKFPISNFQFQIEKTQEMARKYNSIILLKGETDIVCSPNECVSIVGGNAGMTKGGTGDVLAGLVAALYCKNEAFLSACSASFINKKAGDSLYKRVGLYFNSSDLVDEIPKVMKKLIL